MSAAEGGGGNPDLPGSDPKTGIVQGTLERKFTRSYMESLSSLILLPQQTNDKFCVLYSLNNIIKLSPFVKDKTLVSIENFVLGCDRFLKTKAEDRKDCTFDGYFFPRASNFALEAHYEELKKPQEVFMVEIPITHPELPPGTFPAANSSILNSRPWPQSDVKKLPVGMLYLVKKQQSTMQHAISIIPLYPAISPCPAYNAFFIVVDSLEKSITVHQNQFNLYKFLTEEYKGSLVQSFLYYINLSEATAKTLFQLCEELYYPLEDYMDDEYMHFQGGKTFFFL